MEEEHRAVVVHRDSAAVVVEYTGCELAASEYVDCMDCSAAFVSAGDMDCSELQNVVADTDFEQAAVVGMNCEQLVGCQTAEKNTDWEQVVDKHSCLLQIHHQTETVDLDDRTDLIRMTSH